MKASEKLRQVAAGIKYQPIQNTNMNIYTKIFEINQPHAHISHNICIYNEIHGKTLVSVCYSNDCESYAIS